MGIHSHVYPTPTKFIHYFHILLCANLLLSFEHVHTQQSFTIIFNKNALWGRKKVVFLKFMV